MPGTMSGSVRSAARMSPGWILFSSRALCRKRTVPAPAPREAPLPSRRTRANLSSWASPPCGAWKLRWAGLSLMVVPFGFRPGLNEPETLLDVDHEFGVHDHPAVGFADQPHSLGDGFGLGDGKRPFEDLRRRPHPPTPCRWLRDRRRTACFLYPMVRRTTSRPSSRWYTRYLSGVTMPPTIASPMPQLTSMETRSCLDAAPETLWRCPR